METRTYNVYKFNELTKEVQEKVIEKFRNSNTFDMLAEDMESMAQELLEKNHIKPKTFKVCYSLSYCQGDGAMIELRGQWRNYYVTVKQSGHYYHYNSKSVEIRTIKTDNEATENTYDQFEKIYVKICKELEKFGYCYIEEGNKEEVIREDIENNDYDFKIDGTID